MAEKHKYDICRDELLSLIKRLEAHVILADGWREWDSIRSDISKLDTVVHDMIYGDIE